MNVLINDEYNWLDNTKSKIIKDVVKESLLEQEFSKKAEISVMITNNKVMREINKQHRNIDKVTDVLSFPQINWDNDKYEVNDEMDSILLGDVIISTDRLENQAKEYGHSTERELGFLVAHSMLHLLGYDHLSEEEEKDMIRKQKLILAKLGLKR